MGQFFQSGGGCKHGPIFTYITHSHDLIFFLLTLTLIVRYSTNKRLSYCISRTPQGFHPDSVSHLVVSFQAPSMTPRSESRIRRVKILVRPITMWNGQRITGHRGAKGQASASLSQPYLKSRTSITWHWNRLQHPQIRKCYASDNVSSDITGQVVSITKFTRSPYDLQPRTY